MTMTMTTAASPAAAPDRYAVIGNPVAHSKSPLIHAAFARQTGQSLSYEALQAPLDGFRQTVRQFVASGGRGANVTVPFKLEAHGVATELSLRAAQAGAVNTLRFDGDVVYGDNTDGIGLVRDIERLGIGVGGRRVLLLGAGGAARGVLGPLLGQRPARVSVAARRLPKAAELARLFDAPIGVYGIDDLPPGAFDIIINATSASLSGASLALPEGVFDQAQLTYDMMYGRELTAFLAMAQASGSAQVADGLGMLVEQAAESFEIWRGLLPRTAEVLSMVRAAL